MTVSLSLEKVLIGTLLLALLMSGCGGSTSGTSASLADNNSVVTSPVIATAVLPDATELVNYAASLQVSGGVPPYTWKLATSSSLPAGMSFDASQGAIKGVPEQLGTFSLDVTVMDARSSTQSKDVKLSITQKLLLPGARLGSATANKNYTTTVNAKGGTAPYTFKLASGSLPQGLTLQSNGTITGVPTSTGTATFDVAVTDTTSPAQSAKNTFSLDVTPNVTPLAISTTTVPNGTVGTAYSTDLSAGGGTTPYVWTVSAGSLPTGLKLGAGGAIQGTPTAAGSYSFTVKLTDAGTPTPQVATATFAMTTSANEQPPTAQPLAISTSALPNGILGQAYVASASATGGTAPYTWSVLSGALPSSVVLAATTGSLSGTPSSDGTSSFTLQVKDASGSTVQKAFTVSISSTTLDQYGGSMSTSCAATGFFHTVQVNGKWWFCTPEGHLWWMVAMYNVSTDSHTTDLGTSYASIAAAKYGNKDTIWGPQTVRRLKSWGFNSVAEFSVSWVTPVQTCTWGPSCPGGWAENGGKQPVPVPMLMMVQPSMYSLTNSGNYAPGSVKDIQSGITGSYIGTTWNSTFPDLWDANFYAWLDGDLQKDAAAKRAQNSPWVAGWISDECDALFGLCGAGPEMPTNPPGYNQRHQGLMTLVTSPVQNANPGRAMVTSPQVYANQEVVSKTHLKTFLQGRYASISALNNAWGSTYTQWDSTGTQVTGESLGLGDGVTRTFTKTLTNINIAPMSVGVKVAGNKVGGDCPKWLCTAAVTGHGLFAGGSSVLPNAIASGDITYSNGAISITFATAPASGVAVTVDYIRDGWGSGNGLMDEDGRHSWIPTDKVYLGSNTAFNADMDAFLKAMATTYFSMTSERIKHYSPNALYYGPGVMGTWGGVGNKNVLQAASEYVDVLTGKPDYTRLQAQLEYNAANFGDKPVIVWHGAKSAADSALWRYTNPSEAICDPCNTQEERGKFYADSMSTFLNTKNITYNSRTIIGLRWWEFHDNWLEGNWGMVTLQDNAYDGVEACSVSKTDAFGFTTVAEEKMPAWQAGTAYKIPSGVPSSGVRGNRVQATAADGKLYQFEVTVSGTSGSVAPAWPTVEGAKVVDGSVTWKNVGAKSSAACYGDIITQVKKANLQWMQTQ